MLMFDENLFYNNVPKTIIKRTKKYMDEYCLCLSDAFEDAVKELAKPGTELYNAWYYSDFRRFVPAMYDNKYLDFSNYPLKYQV